MAFLRKWKFGGCIFAVMTVGCLAAEPSRADEPLFGSVFTTDLLPQTGWEVEQWLTWRSGKSIGIYNAVEGATELQYGWSDALQIAGYVNYEWAEAHDNNVIDGTTLPPGAFANVAVGPHERLNLTKFTGISGELIYRVLSPYLDPFGLAVYSKPSIGAGLREVQERLILQKNFLDDRLAIALNLMVGQRWRFLHADPLAASGSDAARDHWDEASTLGFAIGGSYRFVANWSAALELVNEREGRGLDPFSSSRRTNSAYYFGPSLHYAGEHVFATLTVLGQLPWGSDFAHPEPDFVVGGRNYAANFERVRVRLKFGYYFGGQV